MPSDGKTNKALRDKYFTQLDDENKWMCVCGKVISQAKNKGYTNLINHLKLLHSDYQMDEKNQSLDKFVTIQASSSVSRKAKNYFCWIEWICSELRPFSFVESEYTRKYCSLEPICRNTLTKIMNLVTRRVERKITTTLPSVFAIIIDGWTKSSTHYVGVFASYLENDTRTHVLLGFSPLLEETSLGASQHFEYLNFILNLYGKSFNNVVCIIADNCETNKALSRLCKVPMIGCASHRFNLAVTEYLSPFSSILNKVHSLMTKLKTVKLSAKLRLHTHLKPVVQNDTRWSSAHEMIKRYTRLRPVLDQHFNDEQILLDFFLTPRENQELANLSETMDILNSVTVALQKDDIDMSSVRLLFDEVLRRVESLDKQHKYLHTDSPIVKDPDFENGIVKIIEKNFGSLNSNERLACQKLESPFEIEVESAIVESADFATQVLKNKRARIENSSGYINCDFLEPTSNRLERLFSSAGICFTDLRQSLSPLHFEEQIFLKENKKFWDIKLVQEAVNEL